MGRVVDRIQIYASREGREKRKPDMSDNIFDKKVGQGMKDFGKYIAIVVRNAMEDFHCKHLSDEQMKELNPIIRNAIYTALYAYDAEAIRSVEIFCRLPSHVDSKILGRAGICEGIHWLTRLTLVEMG